MGKLKSWILLILVTFACVYANAVNPGDETRGEYCLGASSEARGEEGLKLDFKKPELRVLDIGNSFTIDATHYLPLLIEGAELDCSDMCLYVAHRASGSFKSWYDVYNDNDNSSYIIYKQAGGLEADITGSAGPRDGEQFRNTLANNVWDLTIIHQRSAYSSDFDNWDNNSDSGYLNELRPFRKKGRQSWSRLLYPPGQ